MTKRKEMAKSVKVVLLRPHTHQGKLHEPGEVIEVRKDQAERLKKWGVAEADYDPLYGQPLLLGCLSLGLRLLLFPLGLRLLLPLLGFLLLGHLTTPSEVFLARPEGNRHAIPEEIKFFNYFRKLQN